MDKQLPSNTNVKQVTVITGSLAEFLKHMNTKLRGGTAASMIVFGLKMISNLTGGFFASPAMELPSHGKTDRGGKLCILGDAPAQPYIKIGRRNPNTARIFWEVAKKPARDRAHVVAEHYAIVIFIERAFGVKQWMVTGIVIGENSSTEFYQGIEAWATENYVHVEKRPLSAISVAMTSEDGKFADEQ